MLESRIIEKERRDASWTGRRGQAERAALAEMTSTVQGRNAADYAARCKGDCTTDLNNMYSEYFIYTLDSTPGLYDTRASGLFVGAANPTGTPIARLDMDAPDYGFCLFAD